LIRPSRKDHMPVLFEGPKARFQGSQHRHSYPRSFASFECVCDDVALTCDTSLAFSDVLIDLGQVLAFSHRLAKGPHRRSWRLRCCWRLRRTWLRRHRAVYSSVRRAMQPSPRCCRAGRGEGAQPLRGEGAQGRSILCQPVIRDQRHQDIFCAGAGSTRA
jgi:hypothetical protein